MAGSGRKTSSTRGNSGDAPFGHGVSELTVSISALEKQITTLVRV
jgi:hypothetical protein